MKELTVNLFQRLDNYLEDELERLEVIRNKVADDVNRNESKRKRHLDFVKYIVSVATHSIGLRASMAPFNCSQEQVLAYIMSIFNLNESDIKTIIVGPTAGTLINAQPAQQQTVRARKLHSWRPQLRAILVAPTFVLSKKLHFSNLNVRVYVFKANQEIEKTYSTPRVINKTDSKLTKSNSILENIFKRFRLDPAILIRPVNEMKTLTNFIPVGLVRKSLFDPSEQFKTAFVSKETGKSHSDMRINIRRYYCEPKMLHIIRFEFWLETNREKASCLEGYRSCIKRIVFNKASSCCSTKHNSTYMNEDQEFYGFVNIKLNQIPAYPIKQSYPILSLQKQKINNCDISLEFTNRQILSSLDQAIESTNSSKSKHELLINHIRLYMVCLLYQSFTYNDTSSTLESFFYIPAFTLINQNRLQSNLSLAEDRSLRRISILVLLVKLGQIQHTARDKIRFFSIIATLISIAHNEFMIGHLRVDSRTMQEIDLFTKQSDTNPQTVDHIELSTLEIFINNFLNNRLRKWLVNPVNSNKSLVEKSIALSGLKMIKSALSYIMKPISNQKHDFRDKVAGLKSIVNQLICKIVLSYISSKLERVIYSETEKIKRKLAQTRALRAPTVVSRPKSSWLELFNEIKLIDNDICLYWSSKGMNGLILKESEFVKNSGMFNNLKSSECFKVLQKKVDSSFS